MKKLLIIFIFFISTTPVFTFDFSFGIKGDLGWNKFISKKIIHNKEEGDLDENFDYRIGGKVGLVLGFQITDIFAFEPEIMIHFGNGFSITEEDDGFSSYYSRSFTTIELPLILKTKFPLGPGFLAFATGPSLSYNLGEIHDTSEKTIEGSTSNSSTSTTYEDENMNKFSVGFVVGAEYGLPLGSGDLVFGARWEIDLTNMYDNTDSPESEETILRRISIMPSVAYIFRF